MKFYGMELASGTEFTGLVVERSNTTPMTVINSSGVTVNLSVADRGRLYYNTTGIGSLLLWDGTTWNVIASSAGGVVNSFNGRTGNIVLNSTDLVGLINVSNLPKASTTVWGAVKIGAGLVVVDGVISISIPPSVVPVGTIMLFGQASAPTGWTQVNNDSSNNRMLRVVNGGGAGVGGSHDPSIMNLVPSHTHAMSGSTDAGGSHVHNYLIREGGHNPWWQYTNAAPVSGYATRQTDAGGVHSHTLTGSIGANAGAANWTPRYLNIIMCSKD